MYNTVLSQLKKALECKDDKELRLRVEVIVDFMEEESFPQSFPQTTPIFPQPQPLSPYYKNEPMLENQKITVDKSNYINGAPASMGKDQINYSRPAGT